MGKEKEQGEEENQRDGWQYTEKRERGQALCR